MSTFKAKGYQRPKPYETKRNVVSRVKDWLTPSSWWTSLGYEADPDGTALSPRDTSQTLPSDSSPSSFMSVRNGRSTESSLLGTETSSLPQFQNDGTIPQLSSSATKLIAEPSRQLVQPTPAVGSGPHTRTSMTSSHGGMEREDNSMEDDSETSWVAEDDSEVDNEASSGRNPACGVSIERRLSPIFREENPVSRPSLMGKVDSKPSHFLPREAPGTRLEQASHPSTSARVGLTVSEHVVEQIKNPAYRTLSKVSERTPAPGSIFSNRMTSSTSIFSHKLYSTQPVTTSTPQSSPILGTDVEAMDSGTVRNHPQSVALPPSELPRPQDRRQHPPPSHIDTPRPPTTMPHFQSSTPGPAFSVAAFTSPSRLYTNISLSRSPFQSPFYSGRTSFGGMASGQRIRAKRPRTDYSPPRLPPIRHSVKARPAGGRDQLAVSSHTAKKILETLEGLSSPLADARKLPLRGGGPYDMQRPAKRWRSEQSSSSVLSPPPVTPLLTPSHTHMSSKHDPVIVPNERTLSLQHHARPEGTNPVLPQQLERMAISVSQGTGGSSSWPSGGPSPQGLLRPRGTTATSVSHVPTGGLQFGSSPSMSQASPLRNITFAAPPLKQTPPSSTPPHPSSEGGHGSVPGTSPSGVFTPVFHASLPQGGGKMRSHRSPRHVSRRDSSSSSDVVNPMELPPAIPLASNVPSFSFTAGLKVAQSVTPPSLPTSVAMVTSHSSTFSFSTPKPLRSDPSTTSSQQAGPLPFSFSVPKNCSTTTTAKLQPTSKPLPSVSLPSVSLPSVSLPSLPVLGSKPKVTGGKPLPPLQSISVEQILKTPEFQLEGKKAGVGKSMMATVNEVIDLTEEEDEQRTKEPPPPPLRPLPQFTPVQGSWSCDTCMVSNKPSDGKCVACGEPKPGSQNPGGPVNNQEASKLPGAGVQFGSFGGIKLGGAGLKLPATSVGLPGLKLPTPSMAASQVSAGSIGLQLGSATTCKTPLEPKSESETLLKKFAPPSDSWSCDTCMVLNTPDQSSCVACSTPRAGSKKVSSTKEEPAKLALGNSGGFKLGSAGGLVLGGKEGSEPKAALKPLPQFAAPTNAWSCDVCMVSNKPEDSRCAACGTEKPGSDSGTKTGRAEVGSSGTAVQFGAQGGIKLSLGGGMNLLAGSSGGIQLGGKVLGGIELKKPVEQQEAKMAAPEMAPFKLGSGGLKLGNLPMATADTLGEMKSDSSCAQKLTENQLPSQSTGSSVQPIFGTSSGTPAAGTGLGQLPGGGISLGVPARIPAAALPPGRNQNTGGIKLSAAFQFSAPAVSESATTLASQLPTSCLSSSSSTSSSSFSVFKFGSSSQNTPPTSSSANPLAQITFGTPSQVMSTTSAPQLPFASPLAGGKAPSTQQSNPLPTFNFSARSVKPQQQPIGMDAKPTFTFSAAKNSDSKMNTDSTSKSPFPLAGSSSGTQGGFGGANLEQRPAGFSGLKFGVQAGPLGGSQAVFGRDENPQPQQALSTISQAPIFGGPTPTPQQQTQSLSQNLFAVLQQPHTATAGQQPPSFNFHSTQATAGVTQGNSSAPSLSFGSQLGFGQPGSGGNSGGSLTGLSVPQGLGGSDTGSTKFQFGGSNPIGGVFSAGNSTNEASTTKDSSVQNPGFNFSAGGGVNMNFAGGTSTGSPSLMFSAGTSDSSTITNRVIRKARRRKA